VVASTTALLVCAQVPIVVVSEFVTDNAPLQELVCKERVRQRPASGEVGHLFTCNSVQSEFREFSWITLFGDVYRYDIVVAFHLCGASVLIACVCMV